METPDLEQIYQVSFTMDVVFKVKAASPKAAKAEVEKRLTFWHRDSAGWNPGQLELFVATNKRVFDLDVQTSELQIQLLGAGHEVAPSTTPEGRGDEASPAASR